MTWKLQIQLQNGRWVDVHPTGRPAYEYPTQAEALRMLSICYPDELRRERLGDAPTVRVVEA